MLFVFAQKEIKVYKKKFVCTIIETNDRNYEKSEHVKVFKDWRLQSNYDFGFVPLSTCVVPNDFSCNPALVDSVFQVHKRVRESGKPNFLGCRISVDWQLKIPACQKALSNYWDTQLLQLLCFVRKSRRAKMTNFFISIYRVSKSINRDSYLDLSRY